MRRKIRALIFLFSNRIRQNRMEVVNDEVVKHHHSMKARRLLSFVIVGILLLAAAVGVHHILYPKEKTVSDLAGVDGEIVSYTLLDDSRGKHQYEIHLSEFPATFEIPADFSDHFALTRFETDLKKGDKLSVSFPAENADKLVSGGNIPIFAARTKTATYLDEHFSLSTYNNRNKIGKQFAVLKSLQFLLIALGCAILAIVLLIVILTATWKIAAAVSDRSGRRRIGVEPEIFISDPLPLKKDLIPAGANSKLLPNFKSVQKLLADSNAGPKPKEPPTCPVCGAQAEKARVYSDSTPAQVGDKSPIDAKSIPESGAGDANSEGGERPFVEVLRCSVCRRIILEYGRSGDPVQDGTRTLNSKG